MKSQTKIYLDGGDPSETKEADLLIKKAGLGGLDGQTTNPSLIAKNFASKRLPGGEAGQGVKVPEQDAVFEYKRVVTEMSRVIKGPISIQVTLPPDATAEDMLHQARERILWIPNGVIKFPCTSEGLKAVEIFCEEGPVNMTLVFSQEQAAAVYAATKTHNYDVYVSPFVGRLDDRGENGMDVSVNILEMYHRLGDGHVQVLTASIRNIEHIRYALRIKSDVMTIPFKVLKNWSDADFAGPTDDFVYDVPGLIDIPYRELTLESDWQAFDISHDLTTAGVTAFWDDWKSIVNS